jgi:hypothetical protein
MVSKSLTLRMGLLKTKLRQAVLHDDCIALDYTTGRCSLDGDADMSLLPHLSARGFAPSWLCPTPSA